MKVLLTADGRTEVGGTPLLMHNEQLADPLNHWTREIAKVSKNRNKTEETYREMARLEFLGGLYVNGNGPCLPAFNIVRCLQEGAKRIKRGVDVLRGVIPLVQHVDLAYEGPRDPDALWKDGGFALRKTVGIQKSRTMRTRPIFVDWSAVLPVEVDQDVFDIDTLANAWRLAGLYAGLGDMRPIKGKFAGTTTEWTAPEDDGLGEAAYELACAITARQIQLVDSERAKKHGPKRSILESALSKANAFRKAVSDMHRSE